MPLHSAVSGKPHSDSNDDKPPDWAWLVLGSWDPHGLLHGGDYVAELQPDWAQVLHVLPRPFTAVSSASAQVKSYQIRSHRVTSPQVKSRQVKSAQLNAAPPSCTRTPVPCLTYAGRQVGGSQHSTNHKASKVKAYATDNPRTLKALIANTRILAIRFSGVLHNKMR